MENSYHSYAQIDFTLLDDRFGTLEEFRDLVQSAHKIGLRIIVDIVVNHLADLHGSEGAYGSETPFHMHLAEYRLFQRNPGRKYFDFVVNNQYDASGRYGSVYDDKGQRIDDSGPFTGSFWSSDLHHNGDLRDSGYANPWNNHLGKIYGIMDDIRNTHPRVAAKLIAMTKALISSTDIDGVRIDTPMQVPVSFFQQWIPAIRKHAEKLGKHNFGVFGEFYCTRERASTMVGRGFAREYDSHGNLKAKTYVGDENHRMMDGGIHYPLYFWFMDTIKDQKNNVGGLMSLLQVDKEDNDFFSKEWQYRHWHFFNNHDQWRLSTAPDGMQKTMLSSAIIAFWPGIPLFYYGDEQGFSTPGTALDGWARESVMTSLAWRHPEDKCGENPVNPATGDSFDQTNQKYLTVQKIMNLRRVYWNLNTCDSVYERWHQEGYNNGLYAYTRACGPDDRNYVLVIFNTWKETLTIPGGMMYSGWSSDCEIWNIMGQYSHFARKYIPEERLKVGFNGYVSSPISVDGYGVKVFVKREGFRPLSPVVTMISPPHDSVVSLAKSYNLIIRFNQPISVASLRNSITLNGKSLAIELITPEFATEFRTPLDSSLVREGFNKIKISGLVQSSDGVIMNGVFESRFRIGNVATNVLLNGCLNFKEQDLIQESNWIRFSEIFEIQKDRDEPRAAFGLRCMKNSGKIGETGWFNPVFFYLQSNQLQIKLKHNAAGAEKIRVRLGYLAADTSFPKHYDSSKGNFSSIIAISGRNLKSEPASMFMHQQELSQADSEIQLRELEGPWSDWIDYSDELIHILYGEWRVPDWFCNYRVGKTVESSSVKIGFDPNMIKVTVQYWADGSSAYILHSSYQIITL